MKRIFATILFALLAASLSGRNVININRDWRFFSGAEQSSEMAITVSLPHTWNNDALSGKHNYFRGIGNYLKNITAPTEWSGKRVFIKFHGSNAVTSVYLNNQFVGEHRGGTTSFTFEITRLLNIGRNNTIWVIVNNAPGHDVLPTAGDANSYGGIFRDVELLVTSPILFSPLDNGSHGVYISTREVNTDRVEGEVAVKIESMVERSLQLQLAIVSQTGDTVVRETGKLKVSGKGAQQAYVPFEIEKPVLWNGVKNPFLYNVIVKLAGEGIVFDSVGVSTGFRSCTVDPSWGFLLNGEPYPVRGVVVHQDRAMVGTALRPYQVEEDFELIREMGANAVRIAGGAHAPEFYEMCDRNGILVWSEIPFTGPAYFTDKAYLDTQTFRQNGRMQLTETIRQQYNHPSVVMWGIFSCLAMQGDNPVPYVRELNELAKKEDPSRMTVSESNRDGELNFVTDLVVWRHTFGWTEGSVSDIKIWLEQLRAGWSGLRSAVSYSAGASVYHQEDSLYRPRVEGNWHPERWQTTLHEDYFRHLNGQKNIWGIFVANMFDYGAAGRTWGEGNGLNDHGLVTFDRKYRKDAFYFYKANWNSDDRFVYIAQRRWDSREKAVQELKVYSNVPEVELLLNGVSLGKHSGQNGTFVWSGVVLREGANTVEARAGEGLADRTVVKINSGHSKGR